MPHPFPAAVAASDAPEVALVYLTMRLHGWAVVRHTDGTWEARRALAIYCPECEQDRALGRVTLTAGAPT